MLKTFGQQRIWIKRDGTQLPVKESPYDLTVTPIGEDFENATPLDHFNCPYALCLMRVKGSTEVWVGHEEAYVELPDANGKRWMMRFILSAPAKASIGKIDRGELITPHTVKFNKPSKSRTLAAKASAHVSWELNRLKKAAGKTPEDRLTATEACKPKRKADMVGTSEGSFVKKVKKINLVARLRKTGKGMIHFVPKSA